MSDATTFPLQPGERVLWQGRLAVGAPWPSFGRLALGAVALWVALMVPFVVLASWSSLPDLAVFLGVAVGWVYATIALSKVVGPAYLWIFFLLATAPSYASHWVSLLLLHGWAGALHRLQYELVLMAAIVVGVPALVVVLVLLERLYATCVVTDRRLIELSDRGAAVREAPYVAGAASDDLRVEWTWRAPGGALCAGPPWDGVSVVLRDDDPVEVLAHVRRGLRATPRPGA